MRAIPPHLPRGGGPTGSARRHGEGGWPDPTPDLPGKAKAMDVDSQRGSPTAMEVDRQRGTSKDQEGDRQRGTSKARERDHQRGTSKVTDNTPTPHQARVASVRCATIVREAQTVSLYEWACNYSFSFHSTASNFV